MIKCTELMKILLLGAMAEEIKAFSGIEYLKTAVTGVGKTSAAINTQKAIQEYSPDIILFSGVAGALDSTLALGDVGIGIGAIDADFDVRPWNAIYERGELPFGHERVVRSDTSLVDLARRCPVKSFDAYIATGSKFLDTTGKKAFIERDCPELAASFNGGGFLSPNVYEMEGVAVLSTAKSNNIPALVLRVISDTVAGDAPKDFDAFIQGSMDHSVQIVEYIAANL